MNESEIRPGIYLGPECGCQLHLHVWDPCGPLLPVLVREGCEIDHEVEDFDLTRPIWSATPGKMGSSTTEGRSMASDEVQAAANSLVDSAQTIANEAVNLGEDAAKEVLGAVITAVDLLGTALKGLQGQL